MKKTHQIFILLFGLLLSAGCLSGCIKEDLSDCPAPVTPPTPPEPPTPPVEPTTGTLKLALTYTMHNTRENGGYADLFSQQVHKVDVFVFNAEGGLVTCFTEEAQNVFAKNYVKEMELPGGDYRFVVWGNRYDDETASNCTAEGDLLEQSRMSPVQLAQGNNLTMLTDSLFYGATLQPVTVVNGEEQTVPVDLMKDRNDIRVVVRWREKEQTDYCTRPEHAQSITAEITDRNAVYDFMNQPQPKPEVTYLPGHFAAGYDPAFHGDARPYPTEQEHVYVADFSALRLMKDNPDARLTIRQGDSIVYKANLMELITRIEAYRTQEALDREDRYLIELVFDCKHQPDKPDEPDPPTPPDPDEPDPPTPPDPDEPDPPTPPDPDDPNPPIPPVPSGSWTAITITINGWKLVDRPVEL